jgi:hypothetical protein
MTVIAVMLMMASRTSMVVMVPVRAGAAIVMRDGRVGVVRAGGGAVIADTTREQHGRSECNDASFCDDEALHGFSPSWEEALAKLYSCLARDCAKLFPVAHL